MSPQEKLSPVALYVIEECITRVHKDYHGLIFLETPQEVMLAVGEIIKAFSENDVELTFNSKDSKISFPDGEMIRLRTFCSQESQAYNFAGMEFTSIAYTRGAWKRTPEYCQNYLMNRLRSHCVSKPQMTILSD